MSVHEAQASLPCNQCAREQSTQVVYTHVSLADELTGIELYLAVVRDTSGYKQIQEDHGIRENFGPVFHLTG